MSSPPYAVIGRKGPSPEGSDLTDFFVQHGYSFNFVFKGLQEVPDPIAIRLASAW